MVDIIFPVFNKLGVKLQMFTFWNVTKLYGQIK